MSTRKVKQGSKNISAIPIDQIQYQDFDEYALQLIGSITIQSAKLDNLLSNAIFSMANIHPVPGNLIIGQMQISAKLDKIGEMVVIAFDEDARKFFNEIRETASLAIKVRNTISHGIYLGMTDGSFSFAVPTAIASRNEGSVGSEIRGYKIEFLTEVSNKLLPLTIKSVKDLFKLQEPKDEYIQRLQKDQSNRT